MMFLKLSRAGYRKGSFCMRSLLNFSLVRLRSIESPLNCGSADFRKCEAIYWRPTGGGRRVCASLEELRVKFVYEQIIAPRKN